MLRVYLKILHIMQSSSLQISSKFIVFVDVTSAISLESNFPSFDCKVLKIEPYVFSDAISTDL